MMNLKNQPKRIISMALLAALLGVGSSANGQESTYHEAKSAMKEGYWKLWNDDVQKQIDQNIDKNRKANAVVQISNAASGTNVHVEQISHDFIFGAHIFNYDQLGTEERNKRYKNLFGDLFNSATIAFYWKKFEMQHDRPRFKEEYWDSEDFWNNSKDPKSQPHWRRPSPEAVIEFCERAGVRMHGHPIIWGNRKWHHPEWLIDLAPENEKAIINGWFPEGAKNKDQEDMSAEYKKLTADQIQQRIPGFLKIMEDEFERRVVEIAQYYGDRIPSWDVVNESATDYSLGVMLPGKKVTKSHYGIMPGDYTFAAFKTAKAQFPKNVLLNINDYKNDKSYLDQTKDLIKRGMKIDILGSQMHLFNPKQCLDIAEGANIETPTIVKDKMKILSEANLPIHLSEITITAPADDERGRKIQAVVARNLYRLWFSTEKMMGITWWNIVDDCGAPGEPTTSGLFTRNMEPKPSYFALNDLVNTEWKTKLDAKVENNKISFRGFKGKYRLTWKDKDGNFREQIVEMKKDVNI